MASSGSFNTTNYNGRYLQFAWSIPDDGQSISGNKTKINWTLTGKGTASVGYYMSGNFKVVIDGNTVFQSSTRIQLRDGTLVASGSVTLSHDSDGTRSFSASAEAGIYYYDVNCSGNGSWSLPTIARASTISSASNVTLGNKCSVKWTPKHKDFGYKLKFSLGDWSYTTGAITPKTTGAYTYAGYTIPVEVANQLPNSKTGTMAVKLYTYTSSACTTQIGSADSDVFTVTVPGSEAPTLALALSAVNSLEAPFSSLFIQGKTRARVNFSGTEGKHGASIEEYSVTAQGITDSIAPYETGFLTQSGAVPIRATAKDSRGYSTTETLEITVIPYSSPAVVPYTGEKNIVCARCTADGTLSMSGTYLRIKAGRLYSRVESVGAQKNHCDLKYRYKTGSAADYPSTWTTLISGSDLSSDEIDITLGNIVNSKTTSYFVQIRAEDEVGDHSTITVNIPTEAVTLHLKDGGKGAAFGKMAEEDGVFEIAPEWKLKHNGHYTEDFVTEHGTSGIWTYRKWASGFAELWGTLDETAVDCSVQWGGVYITDQAVDAVPSVAFPFSFAEIPMVQASPHKIPGGYFYWLACNTEATVSATGSYWVLRGSPLEKSSLTVRVDYYVSGRYA